MHKFRSVINRMEVEESLPLPHMMDESCLITEEHLKKVWREGEREREDDT